MKKLLICFVLLTLTIGSHSQSPEQMSYQCIVRNENGVLLLNQSIGIRISILQGTPTGQAIYQEIYNPDPQTNANGLVSIEIGSGSSNAERFSTIIWSNGPYFLKVEIDPTGGNSYTIVGTSQLMSVPYALFAKKAESVDDIMNQLYDQGYLRPKDADENFYSIVKIGNQRWLKENLITTKYNDGTVIPSITDNNSWVATTTGAYCDYDNNPSNSEIYGKLYNWYVCAWNNPKNVCPIGWHVPTQLDWGELMHYLSSGLCYDTITFQYLLGKSLASSTYWTSSILNGTPGNIDYPECRNKTGYAALPSGYRGAGGNFYQLGSYCYWWTPSEYLIPNEESLNGKCENIGYDRVGLNYYETYMKYDGFSIRCLRD